MFGKCSGSLVKRLKEHCKCSKILGNLSSKLVNLLS